MRMLRRLRALFGRRPDEHLADELALHRELIEQDLISQGSTPSEARDAARRVMGNETYMREEARGVWIAPSLENAWKDLQYAWRGLQRSPGFAIVAIVSLGVGIGANTAIFGVVNSVMLARLPVAHAQQLFEARKNLGAKGVDDRFTLAEYDALRTASVDISPVTSSSTSVIVDETEDNESLDAVDGRYFQMLGIAPQRGRFISTADDEAAAPVVVISDRFWKTRMHADTAAIGRVITVQRHAMTIIGIAPEGFSGVRFPGLMTITIPFRAARTIGVFQSDDPRRQTLMILGRLQDGQSLAQAQRRLAAVWSSCCATGLLAPPSKPGATPLATIETVDVSRGVTNMKLDVRGRYSRILYSLMAGVAVLLLIACANVGNLLLARAASRQRELAVRLAIGASRRRLLSQLVIESLLLSAIGAVLGLVLARWGTVLLIRANLDMLSGVLTTRANATVLSFTVAISVASGIFFGVVPALRATRGDLVIALKEGGRRARGARRAVLDRGIVAVQLALALLLVSAAALLIETLQNLQRVTLDFEPKHLLATSVETRGTVYDASKMTVRMATDILDRARTIPGVQAVAMTSLAPIVGGRGATDDITIPGFTSSDPDGSSAGVIAVSPGYFGAAGIPIRRGRDFDAAMSGASANEVVVNEAFAKKFFDGRQALGASFRDGDQVVQIIGIAADAKYLDPRSPADPAFYVHVTDGQWPYLMLLVRTTGDAGAISKEIARVVTSVAPGIRQHGMTAADAAIDATLSRERVTAVLAGLFGIVALGLAAVGLYGVMAFQVAGRTVEIGIRMALGARAPVVLWLVLKESLVVVGVGLVFGIPLAMLAGRAVSSQLFGIAPYSVAALGGAAVVLTAVGLVAALVPARRAARINPLSALRAE